jgi:hypothetical protein
MKCSTTKPHWRGHFVVLSTLTTAKVAEIMDPPQPSEASFPQMGVHLWPSLTVQHLCHSPTGPCFPGDNRRPQTTRHQPCSGHFGSWLVDTRQKLEESLISPLRLSPFCIFFLLILASSLPGNPQAFDCDSCMCTTWAGSAVTKTGFPCLLFLWRQHGWVMHPQPHRLLSVLSWWSVYLFWPICHPQEQWPEVQTFTSTGKRVNYIGVNDPSKPVSAIAKNTGP